MVHGDPSPLFSQEHTNAPVTRKRARFPDALVFLIIFIFLAAACTYLLPAGTYERDLTHPRQPVIAGTYKQADHQSSVGVLDVLVSIPKGMNDAAGIIFFVLFIGGALGVVERTGALAYGVETLVAKFDHRPLVVISIGVLVFTTCGVTFGMFEEIIVFVPILMRLMRRLGFDSLTALSVCCIAAIVGGIFSPI